MYHNLQGSMRGHSIADGPVIEFRIFEGVPETGQDNPCRPGVPGLATQSVSGCKFVFHVTPVPTQHERLQCGQQPELPENDFLTPVFHIDGYPVPAHEC